MLALRRLRAAPLFTVFSIGTLAVGIGLTTAAYSVIYAAVWRDLGIAEPDGLFTIPGGVAMADSVEIERQASSLGATARSARFTTALSTGHGAQVVTGLVVSGGYFDVVGAAAGHGRVLQPADDRPAAPPVAVLSHALWQSAFGGDPSVINTTIRLGGVPATVVGVADRTFRGLQAGRMRPDALWVSWSAARAVAPHLLSATESRVAGLMRLARGQTVGQAESELALIASRLDQVAPLQPDRFEPSATRRWRLVPALDESRFAVSQSANIGRFLVAIPALVFLVACTNLANLALSRGTARAHELAVRRAIGASRWAVLREPLAESALVSAAGGLLGLLVAQGLLTAGTTVYRSDFAFVSAFLPLEVGIEPAVVAVAALASIIALVVAGLAPALHLSRSSVQRALAADTASTALPRWRGRSNLIALQVAVSVALFLVTVVVFRVLPDARRRGEPGARLGEVALVSIPLDLQQRSGARVVDTLDAIVAEVALGTDVSAAGLTVHLPNGGLSVNVTTPVDAGPMPGGARDAYLVGASPGALRALGLPVLAGRDIAPADQETSRRVAVVNAALAARLFGAASPIGRSILVERPGGLLGTDASEPMTVVGLVPSSLRSSRGEDLALVYVPARQIPIYATEILARARSGDGADVIPAIRAATRRADPDLAVLFAATADDYFGMEGRALGLVSGALAVLATMTLVLAMAGLAGVMSHVVARRMRELGVRVALGADRGRIVRMVMRSGLRPVIEGGAIGLGVAAVLRLGLQWQLAEPISPVDPVAFSLAMAPLLVAGAVATYVPARRAARVDPNTTLRTL